MVEGCCLLDQCLIDLWLVSRKVVDISRRGGVAKIIRSACALLIEVQAPDDLIIGAGERWQLNGI